MRTPGNDEELALGFLYGEGLITEPRRAGLDRGLRGQHRRGRRGRWRATSRARSFYTTSSCGVCGKGALEEVAVHAPRAARGPDDRARAARRPARAAAPAGLRPHRRAARHRALHARRRAAARARGRRAPQRDGQGDRPRAARGAAPAARLRPVRQRPALVRARPEGRGRGRADPRRRRRPHLARGLTGRRPRHDPGGLRAPRRSTSIGSERVASRERGIRSDMHFQEHHFRNLGRRATI